MKHLTTFRCTEKTLSETGDVINRLFAPKTTKVIVTATKRHAKKRHRNVVLKRATLLSKLAFDGPDFVEFCATDNKDDCAQTRCKFEIEVMSLADQDTLHRMAAVDWSADVAFFASLANQVSKSLAKERLLSSASAQLRSAIIFADERAAMRNYRRNRLQQSNDDDTLVDARHFVRSFNPAVPPRYLPLLMFRQAELIERVGKWSRDASIFYLSTRHGSLLEITAYGVSDATLFCYDAPTGTFTAPFQSNIFDVPDAVREWGAQLREHGAYLPIDS